MLRVPGDVDRASGFDFMARSVEEDDHPAGEDVIDFGGVVAVEGP